MADQFAIQYNDSEETSDMWKIVTLVLLCAVVLGAFVYAFVLREPTPIKTAKPVPLYPHVKAEDLGSSAKELKTKYPALLLSTDRFGNVIGEMPLEGAKYTIWFVADHKEYKAFRIKAVKSYALLDEQKVLKHFAKSYGRPFDATCNGNSTYAMDKCTIKWWVHKTVTLDVSSRHNAAGDVELSAVSTDTYLASKHHRRIKGQLAVQ